MAVAIKLIAVINNISIVLTVTFILTNENSSTFTEETALFTFYLKNLAT